VAALEEERGVVSPACGGGSDDGVCTGWAKSAGAMDNSKMLMMCFIPGKTPAIEFDNAFNHI
jgi:hypothetical protein